MLDIPILDWIHLLFFVFPGGAECHWTGVCGRGELITSWLEAMEGKEQGSYNPFKGVLHLLKTTVSNSGSCLCCQVVLYHLLVLHLNLLPPPSLFQGHALLYALRDS